MEKVKRTNGPTYMYQKGREGGRAGNKGHKTVWNEQCMLKNLWQVHAQAGSLWVAYVHKYILRVKANGPSRSERVVAETGGNC